MRTTPTHAHRTAIFALALATIALPVSGRGEPETHSVTTESQIFALEKVYKSMFGPSDRDRVTLLETAEPELLWVTGIKASMVGGDGVTPQSPEFFCHSGLLRFDTPARAESPGERPGRLTVRGRKMFNLVQGLLEIRFPEGFGMPVSSHDRFVSTVMVMNPLARAEPVEVGVDSRVEFVREAEAPGRMKPLFLVPIVTTVPVAENRPHDAHLLTHAGSGEDALTPGETPEHHHGDGDTCLSHDGDTEVVRSVDRSTTEVGSPLTVSEAGVAQTGHWHVPPGKHVYRHKVEGLDRMIPADTRAHYIAAHLHPFGTSLELVDLTTGETVFRSVAENIPDRIALREITHYSSVEGKPIYRDHEYEIIATYDNTTDEDVDSMAVMYLYLAGTRDEATPPL